MKYYSKVELGKEYKVKHCDFKGIATTSHCYYMGCERVHLVPADSKDGKSTCFDVDSLELSDSNKVHIPNIHECDIVVGKEYKHKLSRISGTAMSVSFYLYQDPRTALLPKKSKDNEWMHFDIGEIKMRDNSNDWTGGFKEHESNNWS